jgi:uncharacterized protein involved in exopolysaccharide biosynthesis
MRMSEYFKIFRRRWLPVFLAMLVTAVAAYVFSKLQEPLYRSEASYLVVPNRNDNGLSIVLCAECYRVFVDGPTNLCKGL